MANANEWLNRAIPTDKKNQATTLRVYSSYQYRQELDTVLSVGYMKRKSKHNINGYQNDYSTPPNYYFCNVILEGELDLNDFVSLQELEIVGTEQQQQKLTKLKVDKCIGLISITINYTSLGYLSLGSKPKLKNINFNGNKRLIFCDITLKNLIERLTNLALTAKSISLSDLKLEIKKIKEENLVHQLDVIKNSLDLDNQLWLESLVEAQQEVLYNNNTFAHKQLVRCKKKLSEVLTDEEIKDILGKKIEINELESQLNRLNNLSLNN
ncbi:20458_t:CDS:1 [Cetraspora pellucida]|uniref:20458_t:CDS:1 n=1 Tax=Cetraspora pellucida TaxID=1433469 RepID=A0A9N9KCC0_9GLOM|nr:20458_t:CDS:1 [Cetraspora pellucida]